MDKDNERMLKRYAINLIKECCERDRKAKAETSGVNRAIRQICKEMKIPASTYDGSLKSLLKEAANNNRLDINHVRSILSRYDMTMENYEKIINTTKKVISENKQRNVLKEKSDKRGLRSPQRVKSKIDLYESRRLPGPRGRSHAIWDDDEDSDVNDDIFIAMGAINSELGTRITAYDIEEFFNILSNEENVNKFQIRNIISKTGISKKAYDIVMSAAGSII